MTELAHLFQILLSLACGASLGLDRERRAKPAGVRTCALVAVGSTLFCIVSQVPLPGVDPTRIAAQVCSGVSFLGMSTILTHRNKVVGLTTSAVIWCLAAIGMAIDFKMYVLGVTATLAVLSVVYLVEKIDNLKDGAKR